MNDSKHENPNIQAAVELNKFANELLYSENYIAKSDYKKEIETYADVVKYFVQLENDDLLNSFCKKNKIGIDEIRSATEFFTKAEKIVAEHNEKFILEQLVSGKNYLDDILK